MAVEKDRCWFSIIWPSKSRGQVRGVLVYGDKTPARKLMKRVGSAAEMEWGSRKELEPKE